MRKIFVPALLAVSVAVSAQAADKKKAAKPEPKPVQQEKQEPPPPPDLPRPSQENRQFIKTVQDMLVKAGHMSAREADGKLGARTKEALRQFQKANGLKDDGRLTPESFERLAQKTRE